MSTLVLAILVYTSVSGAINQPFVTFTPNWNKIFKHEEITMRCNVESAGTGDGNYKWYKDGVQRKAIHQSIYIGSALPHHSGRYQCQFDDSQRSDPVSLHVNNDGVILQAPISVIEGESLYLRCHSVPGRNYDVKDDATFFKNGEIIQTSDQNSNYFVSRVTADMAGRYHCEKNYTSGQILSDESFIIVKEVFSFPEIVIPPSPMVEGDRVTLTCDALLGSVRQKTELQFAFYRDGQNIQEFSTLDQYGAQSAQLEDSGNYSCEVRTSDYSVTKMSKEMYLQIQSLFSMPRINATSDLIPDSDNMTLTCDTSLSPLRQTTELQFAFYREDLIVLNFGISDQYGVQSAQLEDAGNYYCEVKASNSNVKKRSDMITIVVQGKTSKEQVDYKLQNIIRLVLSGLIVIAIAILMYNNAKRS